MKGKQRTLLNSIGKLTLLLLFSLLSTALSAQNKKISGKVIDEKHQPVLGASVVVKGTTKGTTTDFDGNFTIEVPAKATLSVSFIGYHTQNVAVGNQNQLTIVLKEEQEQLDEVVVVGYGTVRKKDLTGAVTSVSNKALKEKPIANAGEALQGRAAGVQVTSAGKPGDNVSFRIRGISTINNSEPLLVIDGVPTDLGINALNVDDIENIDVLKDASATAIYGSRGANGVVLISTKKGKNGDGKLSFSTNIALQQATNLPVMLNAREFASFHNEMIANYNRTPGVSPLSQRPDFANPEDWGEGTNWLKALFRPAFMRNYSLSYSGGNDKSNYYVSGGVFDQDGIILNTSYRRYTVQFNGESRVKPWIKFGNNLTLSHDEKKSGDYNIRMAMASLPTQPIYNEDGSYSGPDSPAHQYSDIRNVVGTALINGQNTTKGYNILGNIFAEITPVKHLVFKTTGGLDFKYWDNRSFSPKYNWKPIPNPLSNLYQDANKSTTLLWDNTLTYTNTFAQKHFLNVMVGTSAQNNVYSKINASVSNFLSDQQNQLSKGLENPTVGGTMNDWAILSFIGRLNYTYADKYLLTATVRRDGSSRFHPKHRWGNFWSFGGAWIVTKEPWFKVKGIDMLKLKASFGQQGNDAIGDFYYSDFYNLTAVNGEASLAFSNKGKRDITWETNTNINTGVEFELFNRRLTGGIEYYQRKTTDMLLWFTVPPSLGYGGYYDNVGDMMNRGIEVNLDAELIRTKALTWAMNFNITHNSNKVSYLPAENKTLMKDGHGGYADGLRYIGEGLPVNTWYMKRYAGVNEQGLGTWYYTDNATGKQKTTTDYSSGDDYLVGNPHPDVYGGFGTSLRAYGFDLNISFIYSIGGKALDNGYKNLMGNPMSTIAPQSYHKDLLKAWTRENPNTSVPRFRYGDNNTIAYSDRFLIDASTLTFKSISLGYNFPSQLIKKLQLSSLRVFLSCDNVAYWSKRKGFDPRTALSGDVYDSVYPTMRTASAGISVKF